MMTVKLVRKGDRIIATYPIWGMWKATVTEDGRLERVECVVEFNHAFNLVEAGIEIARLEKFLKLLLEEFEEADTLIAKLPSADIPADIGGYIITHREDDEEDENYE